MTVTDEIRGRLAALAPICLDIIDESALHVGHAGAQGGGRHFRVAIVSKQFTGESSVARHRMVYRALGDLVGRSIHALAIEALAPDEAGKPVAPTR